MAEVSRRAFLAGLAATAVGLALDPYRFVTAEGDLYRNGRLGLQFRVPSGWSFSSIADFASLRDRQDLLDAELGESHPLRDPLNLPVVVIEDERANRGEANPGIVLFEEAVEPHDEIVEGTDAMLARFGRSYRDVAVLEPPRLTATGNVRATEAKWRYVHDVDGVSYARGVYSLVTFPVGNAHTFHMATDPENDRLDDVWRRFVGSIRYD